MTLENKLGACAAKDVPTMTRDIEVMTLCNRCADALQEDGDHELKRVDPRQKIQEPCFICEYKGWEYEVERVKCRGQKQ